MKVPSAHCCFNACPIVTDKEASWAVAITLIVLYMEQERGPTGLTPSKGKKGGKGDLPAAGY